MEGSRATNETTGLLPPYESNLINRSNRDSHGASESLNSSNAIILEGEVDEDNDILKKQKGPEEKTYGVFAGYAIAVNYIIGTGVFG